MILVGSRSLSSYINLDRFPDDWDLWMQPEESRPAKLISYGLRQVSDRKWMGRVRLVSSEAQKIELTIVTPDCGTDWDIFRLVNPNRLLGQSLPTPVTTSSIASAVYNTVSDSFCSPAACRNNGIVQTPIGMAWKADIEIHKLLKASSLPLGKPKNEEDLRRINMFAPGPVLWPELLERRLEETRAKVKKDGFFNKYRVTRYVDHDLLHAWVAQALGDNSPAYTRLLEPGDPTRVSEDRWNALSDDLKAYTVIQEALVLAIERYLIPAVAAGKGNCFTLFSRCLEDRTSADPGRFWLDRLCSTKLKDHPVFIARWAAEHYAFLIMRRAVLPEFEMPEAFWECMIGVKNGVVEHLVV